MRFRDLIGAPYVKDARGPVAFNCEGLAIEMQRRQGRTVSLDRLHKAEWRRIERPEPGCVVYFPTEQHVGTMLDGMRFFHTTSEVGDAHIDSLESVLWRRKRRAFYLPR